MADEFDPHDFVAGGKSTQPGMQEEKPTPITELDKIKAIRDSNDGIGDYAKAALFGFGSGASPVGIALPSLVGSALGTGAAAGEMLANGEHSYDSPYDMAKDAFQYSQRLQNDAMSKHPVMAGIGGLLGASVNPLGSLARGTTMLGRIGGAGILGALQGAGSGETLDDALKKGEYGALAGLAGGALGEGVGYGAGYIGEKLKNLRPNLISKYLSKGEQILKDKPELEVNTPRAVDMGRSGPSAYPELQTSPSYRTELEQSIEANRPEAERLIALGENRPRAATKQLMGENMIGKPLRDVYDIHNDKIFGGIRKALSMSGTNVPEKQLAKNFPEFMRDEGLNTGSNMEDIVSRVIGEDTTTGAKRGMGGYSVAKLASVPGRQSDELLERMAADKKFMDAMSGGQIDRFGQKVGQAPAISSKIEAPPQATVPGTDATGISPLNKAVAHLEAPEPPKSGPAGFADIPLLSELPGQPASSVQYGGFTPKEATKYGGSAEQANMINLGRASEPGVFSKVAGWAAQKHIPGGRTLLDMLGGATGAKEAAYGAAGRVGNYGKPISNAMSTYAPMQNVAAGFIAGMTPGIRSKEEEELQSMP